MFESKRFYSTENGNARKRLMPRNLLKRQRSVSNDIDDDNADPPTITKVDSQVELFRNSMNEFLEIMRDYSKKNNNNSNNGNSNWRYF